MLCRLHARRSPPRLAARSRHAEPAPLSEPPEPAARRIRVSPTVLAAGPITCGVCGTDFTPDQPDNGEDENGEGEPP